MSKRENEVKNALDDIFSEFALISLINSFAGTFKCQQCGQNAPNEEWHDDGTCLNCTEEYQEKNKVKKRLTDKHSSKTLDVHQYLNIFDNVNHMKTLFLLLETDPNMSVGHIINILCG
jgi:hypothetical protein